MGTVLLSPGAHRLSEPVTFRSGVRVFPARIDDDRVGVELVDAEGEPLWETRTY